MRPAQAWLLGLFVALALAVVGLGARVARRLELGGAARLELARVRPTALTARTLARFGSLQERVLVTYYVSPPARMPAAMRRMELEVTDLLAALKARFPAHFDYHVVDPESEPGLAGFAARRRVAPFRVRSVTRDAWDERTVWSTLALAFGSRPEALLAGLGPEHLPHLQELLVRWLEQLGTPRQPRIALAAPAGFEELADELATRGELARVELDSGADLPEADLLLWMRPQRLDGRGLRALAQALSAGTSVILAGNALAPVEEVRGEVPYVSFRAQDGAFGEIAAHFGLRLGPELVLDATAEELEFGSTRVPAPHWVRCIAPQQDFHRFLSQPNGTLLFRAASPLLPEPARLAELGLTAEVLATSSDRTWLLSEPPHEPRELASLAHASEVAAPKQALAVALRSDRPWHGELVFLAAETPFADGFFRREHAAHARLLDVLVDEATTNERLVLAEVELAQPEPLREFSALQRLAARALVLLLPVLLLVIALHGRSLVQTLGELICGLGRAGRRLLAPAGLLAATLGVLALTRRFDIPVDLTAEGLNELTPAARALAARAAARGPVRATLYLSRAELVPPALRGLVRALEDRLEDFGRAGVELERARVYPEDLAAPERSALAARGIASAVGSTEEDGVRRVTRFTSALLLAQGGQELVLDFADARAFERLEFRISFALERLGGLRAPRVAFASDIPRLSAAEAYEYQKQGLFAPGGNDVYAEARATLLRNDLEVQHVNPRAPVLPAGVDALVWLQPRRSIEPMLPAAVRHLVGGGTLVLAAQHFSLKPQQFRGGDFEPKFWPQPQNPDLEHLYFPELGIELVREVLFDALNLPIQAESQLTGRQGAPDFERQASAQPFQIRLSSAGFADHPMMRGLGDQAFLFANRIRWDAARLAALGLTATPLAFTSQETWSYAWKGGWIPPELLAGPAELEGSSGSTFMGPQPVVVLFEGTFPPSSGSLELNPSAEAESEAPTEPWPPSGRGRLVLIGDAEFVTNAALGARDLRGDHLLWNAVASTVFTGELAELATRARVGRGFGLVAPEEKLLGRALVIASGPTLLLLLSLASALHRRRPPRVSP
jgi:hypothetical protein